MLGAAMAAAETWTGTRDVLDERTALAVAAALRDALDRRAHAVIGLVGGRSVGGIHARLAAIELPWERVHVFLADERLVPTTSEESNYRQVRADLLSGAAAAARLPAANLHACTPDPGDPAPGIAAYGAALDRLGGRFDAVVLSAGEDGHCASLFPRHRSIDEEGARFVLVEDAPKPPPRRVSATRGLLERSGAGWLVVYGEGKRDALRLLRDPAVPVRDCPAKLLASLPHATVVTDLGVTPAPADPMAATSSRAARRGR